MSEINVTLWRTWRYGRRSTFTWRTFIDTIIAAPEVVLDKKKVAGFSIGAFTGNYRSKPSVEKVHALTLDFDQGDTTIAQATTLFPGAWCIAYTTFSSKPEHPKLRLVIPLARDVDADEYERIWIWAERQITPKGHKLDESARDASRFWFLPSHPPGAKYEWSEVAGTPFDPEIALREIAAHTRPFPGPTAAKGRSRVLTGPGKGRDWASLIQGDSCADESFFGRAFEHAGMAFELLPNGALPVVCPWAADHTCGVDGDSSTVILPSTTDARWGLFKCSHAHCARRVTLDLLDALPPAALEAAREAHGRGMVRVRVVNGWRQRLEAMPGVASLERFILRCRGRIAAPFSMTVKEQSSMHLKYLDGLPVELLLGRRLDVSIQGRTIKAAKLVLADLDVPSIEKRARGAKILSAYEPGDSVQGPDHDFLFGLLLQHPRLEEKIGRGVSRIRVAENGSKRFEVVRIDGSIVDLGLRT